jgi:hypothetical protein
MSGVPVKIPGNLNRFALCGRATHFEVEPLKFRGGTLRQFACGAGSHLDGTPDVAVMNCLRCRRTRAYFAAVKAHCEAEAARCPPARPVC